MELDSREITVVALDIQSICIQSIYFVVSVVNVYFILQVFFSAFLEVAFGKEILSTA